MFKRMKKQLAVCLAVLLLFSAAPLGGMIGLDTDTLDLGTEASAIYQKFYYQNEQGSCGPNAYYIFDPQTYTLTIKGSGAVTSGFDMDDPFDDDGYDLPVCRIVIEDGITSICESAFAEGGQLVSVDFGNTLETIGAHAFEGCHNLKNVVFPDSLKTIGNGAFTISSVQNVTFGKGEITIGNGAFSQSDLKRVDFNGSIIHLGEYVFAGNGPVAFSNAENVIELGAGALESTGLTEWTLNDSITKIPMELFGYNRNLGRVTFGANVTEIDENAFVQCQSLTDVYFTGSRSQWNAITVKSGNDALASAAIHYAYDHPHDTTAVVTPPTCTSQGYTTYTCAECGMSEQAMTKPALGHEYEITQQTPATETQSGSVTYTCARCGDTYTETVAPHTHRYTADVIAATCCADGSTAYTCAICGYSYTETQPALGHQNRLLAQNKAHTFAAYCCDRCGWKSYNYDASAIVKWGQLGDSVFYTISSDTITIFGSGGTKDFNYAYSHCSPFDWDFGYFRTPFSNIVVEEGVTKLGSTLFYDYNDNYANAIHELTLPKSITDISGAFSYCDFNSIRYNGTPEQWNAVQGSSALSAYPITFHAHTYGMITEQPPTCTEPGFAVYICTDCGETYTQTLAALGHHYLQSSTGAQCEVCYTCERCGDTHSVYEHQYSGAYTPATCTQKGSILYTCDDCGSSYSVGIPALGHSYEEETIAPTCTQAGRKVNTCIRCGHQYTVSTIPATGHRFTLKSAVPPTCTQNGLIVYQCSACGEETQKVTAATGHNYTLSVITTPATASTPGVRTLTCAACGDSYTEAIPAHSHEFELESSVAPTCQTSGSLTYICKICGCQHTQVTPPAHQYQVTVVASTCMAQGYTKHVCSLCGDTYYSDYVSTVNHLYKDTVIPPTCTEQGYTKHVCSLCGDTYYSDYTDTVDHTYEDTVIPPTCAEQGCTAHICSMCGYTYKTDFTEALPHTYIETVIPPTCLNEGYTLHTCSVCGASYQTDFVPSSNNHKYNLVSVTQPTCSARGYSTFVCEYCGEQKNDQYTDPLPHTPGVITENVAATCHSSGYIKRRCLVCGENYIAQTFEKLEHDYKTTVYPPTCTEKGYTVFTCRLCNTGYVGDYVNATGHSYQDVVTPPTCTDRGYTTSTCINCGKKTSKNYVAALGHDYQSKTVPPTCTEEGCYLTYCSRCDYTQRSNLTPALGHTESDWRLQTFPTETQSGALCKACTVCGDTLEQLTVPAYQAERTQGLAVSSVRETLAVGDQITLTAELLPPLDAGTAVTWSSTCGAVAEVSGGIVTAVGAGTAVIIAQAGAYRDYCVVSVSGLMAANGAVIDETNHFVYGLPAHQSSAEPYITTDGEAITLECDGEAIGTGTQIRVMRGGVMVDAYEAVIFGDTNGDGWYDGQDAFIVNCIANGLLMRDQIGEAAYMAADCNHDGVVDAADVLLLEQAGLMLSHVDQTKDDYMETEAFAEYLSLIDQNPDADEEPVEEPAEEPAPAAKTLVQRIMEILQTVVTFLRSLFPKI